VVRIPATPRRLGPDAVRHASHRALPAIETDQDRVTFPHFFGFEADLSPAELRR
jgi:hypothetical protein